MCPADHIWVAWSTYNDPTHKWSLNTVVNCKNVFLTKKAKIYHTKTKSADLAQFLNQNIYTVQTVNTIDQILSAWV